MPVCPGGARAVRLWSDGDLWEGADLVVLATVVSTQAPMLSPTLKPSDVITVETTFTADHILKGSLSSATLRLSHLAYGDPAYWPQAMINGGPGAISFDKNAHRQYLLFLKHDKGDTYSPLSGQRDPELSIRMIVAYRPDIDSLY